MNINIIVYYSIFNAVEWPLLSYDEWEHVVGYSIDFDFNEWVESFIDMGYDHMDSFRRSLASDKRFRYAYEKRDSDILLPELAEEARIYKDDLEEIKIGMEMGDV